MLLGSLGNLLILFRHLGPHVLAFFPVEAAAAGLFLHGEGLEHGRHGLGDATHHGFVAVFLLGFHQLPGIGNFLGRCLFAGLRAKHVRMAEHHFVAHLVNAVSNVKCTFLLTDTGIKHHVVQQVANLLGRPLPVPLQDGVAEFVHLFLRHRADGIHGLCGVPGAFYPELVHNVQQAPEGGQFFFSRVHDLAFWKHKDTTICVIFVD